LSRIATVAVAASFALSILGTLSRPGAAARAAEVRKPGAPRVILRATRQADTDLEVGGELAGLPSGSTRYVAYNDLLRLPQVAYTVSDDSNLAAKTRIAGIPLDQLPSLLGGDPKAKLVVAICYDGYRTNYPAAYLAAHRPLLVLKINGKTEEGWPKSEYGGALGPYLISHPAYTPLFKVLSHTDEPQIPFGVTRVEFRQEQTVLGSIAPLGVYPPNSPVINGYRIAQQNCFRCHNMGAEGGQMAGRGWPILAMWAATEPRYFMSYVKNPQALDPKNHMPGNPQYDAATIDALRQYFSTFAPADQRKGAK
jgi:mono/diheme cytochrome c family protein/rhodanese-related sulfurtransferase